MLATIEPILREEFLTELLTPLPFLYNIRDDKLLLTKVICSHKTRTQSPEQFLCLLIFDMFIESFIINVSREVKNHIAFMFDFILSLTIVTMKHNLVLL